MTRRAAIIRASWQTSYTKRVYDWVVYVDPHAHVRPVGFVAGMMMGLLLGMSLTTWLWGLQ